MPKRTVTKTVKGGPQGSDAFFVFRHLTVGESQKYGPRVRAPFEGDPDDEVALTEHNQAEDALVLEHNLERLSTIVLDWNWVDDNDDPLPKPENNPDVFRQLNGPEMNFISDSLTGNDETEKKGRTNSQRR